MKSHIYGRHNGRFLLLRHLVCATALSGLFFIHVPLCAARIADHASKSGVVHISVTSGTPVNIKTDADVIVTFAPGLNTKKQSKLAVTTSGSVSVSNLPPGTFINIYAHGTVAVTYAAGPYSGKQGGINIVCGGDTTLYNVPQGISVNVNGGGNVTLNYKSAMSSSSSLRP